MLGSLVNGCGRSGQKRQIFFVCCLMPPLSIFGGYHLAPTAILDFQDGRHDNTIGTNISASKRL